MLPRSFVTRALPAAAAAVLLLGASACTDDDDPPDSTPTTTRPSTSTTTTEAELTDEEQIEALLTEWFDVVNEIVALDRPVSDASEFISGEYLTGFEFEIEQRIEDGFDTEISSASEQQVESVDVDGETGRAVTCIVDANVKVVADTGEVVDDEVSVTRYSNSLAMAEGGWRITRRTIQENLPPDGGCPS